MLGHVIAEHPIASTITNIEQNLATPQIKIYRDNSTRGSAVKVRPGARIIRPMRG